MLSTPQQQQGHTTGCVAPDVYLIPKYEWAAKNSQTCKKASNKEDKAFKKFPNRRKPSKNLF